MFGKKISVIMGIYNCATTLPDAVESIVSQTYKNWELIMCDDGSTDDTFVVAQTYANRYENIVVIQNEKNMRLAYTLNHCLKHVTGYYVARMDADDISLSNRLKEQYIFLESNPEFDVVGCALQIKDESELKYIRRYSEYPMKENVWKTTPFAHPTIMMKKSAFDALDGYRSCPETMRAEDLDMWFRFKILGLNGYNIQESLYLYQESLVDYKKRTYKAACGTAKILWKYYRELQVSHKYDYLVIKPIIAAILPAKIMYSYHEKNSNSR